MDAPYADLVSQIDTMSKPDLEALQASVKQHFEEADTANDLEAMAAAATVNDKIMERLSSDESDEDPAEEVTETPAKELAEPDPVDEEEDPVTASATPEAPEAAVTAGAVTAPTTPNIEGQQEAAVDQDIPKDRQPVATTNPVTVTAGADVSGKAAGSEFNNIGEVNDAFIKRLHSLRNASGADGDQLIVASVNSSVDDSRYLTGHDSQANLEKIMAQVAPTAIVAAGGYCAPLEVRYELFGLGSGDRPVRDALSGFQADRGGIRYIAPPKLGDYTNAIGLWTAANDANPTNPTTKPCLTVTCGSEVTVSVDAITLCLKFGNLMTRAYPELISRHNELALIQQARFAEQTLLSKITSLSTAVTSAYKLGVARDWMHSLGRAASAYRVRHRMAPDAKLRVIAPAWVRDEMREDLMQGKSSIEDLEFADARINGAITARNVNITWHLDDANFATAQAAGATVKAFPASFDWWIFAEGTFLFLDGGTLDIGIVRDSTLVGTNDYQVFVETFESVAKVGIESLKVTTTTQVQGAVAADIAG